MQPAENATPPSPKHDPHQAGTAAIAAMSERLLNFFAANVGLVVQNGPFTGMQYVERSIGSSLMPKLLGSYEANLQPVIEEIIRRAPATIVNVGCGEGYYAVGLARRLPHARVYAFEADPTGQAL